MARAGRPNKTDPRFNEVDWLIRQHDNEGVKKILSETGLEATDSYLRTALILATLHKNADLLGWLISQGANVNHQDRNGASALHFAGQEKNEEAAKLLLKAGADLNVVDVYGNAPLWRAVFNAKDDLRVVELYVQGGANLADLAKYPESFRKIVEAISKG
ncbi:ankyrin repeat domain-containing protein [Hymenobacter bucti]|uniref:Ankyrin repeat domain-containing protein n=1 Tax=Hymenobacter bucti TaxID=1844114 RepID=A0ABW4QTB3_9BACT